MFLVDLSFESALVSGSIHRDPMYLIVKRMVSWFPLLFFNKNQWIQKVLAPADKAKTCDTCDETSALEQAVLDCAPPGMKTGCLFGTSTQRKSVLAIPH